MFTFLPKPIYEWITDHRLGGPLAILIGLCILWSFVQAIYLLRFLSKRGKLLHAMWLGIRTGVISNLLWSGEALRERLDRLLPNNHFEFIMTSSDYIFRKPNPILFEIALRKAGLPASEVWYCGDNPEKDIEGASAVGIFPVHYDNDIEKSRDRIAEIKPKCEHLYIKEWDELIRILK